MLNKKALKLTEDSGEVKAVSFTRDDSRCYRWNIEGLQLLEVKQDFTSRSL
jgi:hypothetical protein